MLELNKTHYIGEGLIRTCYEHPDDKALCIKVPKEHVARDYTYKEILYHEKIAKRSNSKFSYQFYSDYKGEIDTNFGLGQVFDLVRDEQTGDISKTLEYYLTNPTQIPDDTLWNAMMLLKQQMMDHKVFTRDLRARNLCCQIGQDNSVKIVIIDGIGHRDFFPLADLFAYFSRKKIERTFNKWHFTSIEDQRAYLQKEKLKAQDS